MDMLLLLMTTDKRRMPNTQKKMTVDHHTRNTLDCDQYNYSSRIVFSHIPIEFGETGNSAIRSADLENPTLGPNRE